MRKFLNKAKSQLSKKIPKNYKLAFSKAKRRFLKNIWFARFTVLVAIFVIAYINLRVFLSITNLDQFVDPAKNFIFSSNAAVANENGRTNVLVLGKGGEGHEAPDLTDTILLISVSHQKPKAAMISIPRDIWLDSLQAKVNSAYYWGRRNGKGGLELAKQSVSEVIGQPVHYAVVIDFSGFKSVIDTLGGVEVEVERAFIDRMYPIAGRENDECGGDKEFKCRYETIEFVAGRQFMDGERALKYVRSRHAEGDEGTDTARSARQQRLISAIREKLLTSGVVFNPQKINELVNLGERIIETDVPKDVGGVLARRAYEARDSYQSHLLPENLLLVPPISRRYLGQYVFIPKNSWDEVHQWIESILP